MASLPHRPISIVTLLTNDEYLPGVTALLYSIKVNINYTYIAIKPNLTEFHLF